MKLMMRAKNPTERVPAIDVIKSADVISVKNPRAPPSRFTAIRTGFMIPLTMEEKVLDIAKNRNENQSPEPRIAVAGVLFVAIAISIVVVVTANTSAKREALIKINDGIPFITGVNTYTEKNKPDIIANHTKITTWQTLVMRSFRRPIGYDNSVFIIPFSKLRARLNVIIMGMMKRIIALSEYNASANTRIPTPSINITISPGLKKSGNKSLLA